jgi:acyl dehydratase
MRAASSPQRAAPILLYQRKIKLIEVEYFEDYRPGTQRVTPGRTITEADLTIHAGHSGDFFPHHVDAEFAREGPFGQRVAHGTLTFTIGIGLTAGRINPVAFTYGYDRLRFLKPVLIGDTLKTRVTLKEKREDLKHPGHGRVVETCEVLNQRDEIVMYCEHILLVAKRPLAQEGA